VPCRLPPAKSGRVKRLDPVCVLEHGLRRPKAVLNVTTPRRQVLSTLPKPQRSLWARLALPDGQVVTVVSWHTPNAAGDSRAVKMDAYQATTDWLHDSHPNVTGTLWSSARTTTPDTIRTANPTPAPDDL
jgi:hypothetical protein